MQIMVEGEKPFAATARKKRRKIFIVDFDIIAAQIQKVRTRTVVVVMT